jgi:hypothetical protein
MIGNEPACPFQSGWKENLKELFQQGITIRQEFVKAAMQGLLSAYVGAGVVKASNLAEQAVFAADACLKAEMDTRK